jgi:sugar phosphate isomerase/epimerase
MTLGISLAQWSLHRTIRSGRLRGRDFPRVAKEEFGIDAIELVNSLLGGDSRQMLQDLRRQAADCGVRILLVMVDDEGDLSHPRRRSRRKAARNHRRWVDAAAFLGCHSIRVNTGGAAVRWNAPLSSGVVASVRSRCLESCQDLADYAAPAGIHILLENHGGLSSNIPAVVELVREAGRENLGTLPDFGNFPAGADRYASIELLLPHARAVSAKTFDFDGEGRETTIDYARMMELVRASGYSGHLGIEYEGARLPEPEGIRRSKRLLEKYL